MQYQKPASLFLLIIFFILANQTAQASVFDNIKIKSGGVIADQEFSYANPLMSLPHGVRPGLAFSVETKILDVPGGALLAKVQYVQKGILFRTATTARAANGTTTSSIRHYDNRADYLSVPLLYEFIIPGLPFLAYATAGPRVDFLLNAQSDAFPGVYKNLRTLVVGADAGLGIEYPFSPLTLTAEVRYSHDFTDAFESTSLRVKNKTLGIWLGVGLL